METEAQKTERYWRQILEGAKDDLERAVQNTKDAEKALRMFRELESGYRGTLERIQARYDIVKEG